MGALRWDKSTDGEVTLIELGDRAYMAWLMAGWAMELGDVLLGRVRDGRA